MRKKISLDKYLDVLAARNPVPGGGSAAALVGSIGMALISMAAKYILKKDKAYKIAEIVEFSEIYRRRLRKLMEEDEAAYLCLWKNLKKRSGNTARSYKNAIEVPLEVCAIAREGITWCEYLCCHCKTSIVCDVAEAAILLEAAFLSAAINATINLCGVKDKNYTRKVRNRILKQKSAVAKMKTKLLKKIHG